ncbi:MAG: MoaD/ThiS family protein [Paludibacter sp.]|nr:MoaD/ThiS family protein [Paludibacter sp.]
MISYNLVMYGALKDFFPSKMSLELADECTVKVLIGELKLKFPEASDVLSVCQLAVNDVFVSDEKFLLNGTEIVLLPPFSGG